MTNRPVESNATARYCSELRAHRNAAAVETLREDARSGVLRRARPRHHEAAGGDRDRRPVLAARRVSVHAEFGAGSSSRARQALPEDAVVRAVFVPAAPD